MTRAERALTTLLRGVQRREARRRRWRRVSWAGAVGLGTLALCGLWQVLHASLTLASISVPLALGLAVGVAALTLVGLEIRAAPIPAREAARLADRRLGLHDLLGTALTLPERAEDPLEAALHARIHAQAEEAALPRRPADVVPPPPLTWIRLPAGLAALSLALWLAPPLAAPLHLDAAVEPRADVIRTPGASEPTAGTSRISISSVAAPEAPGGQTANPEQEKTSASPSTAQAGGESSSKATTATGASSLAPGLDRPHEARGALTPQSQNPAGTRPNGGTTRNTPFGSRESGSFGGQATASNPKALAAAPYDPSAAGNQVQRQKNGGPPEERRASGGRGVESDGDDRCAQDCLTNSDMNRGAAPQASKPPAPDDRNRSGTSGSGGGAAGSTSGVGLGNGRMATLALRFRQQLLAGNGRQGERVRVLAAPGAASPGSMPGPASAGPWTPQAELPLTPDQIPAAARDTVGTYFRRHP